MLQGYKRQTQEALADIRRLAYDLRPPALDQLGLVSALRDHIVSQVNGSQVNGSGIQVSIDAPASLPPLSAAVEVAAYRIALEALTNVVHHAQAQHCWISLRLDDALHLEVTDDGCGIAPAVRHGVGLTSMCERAAELGGVCTIGPGEQGGTLVSVVLPIGEQGLRWNRYAS